MPAVTPLAMTPARATVRAATLALAAFAGSGLLTLAPATAAHADDGVDLNAGKAPTITEGHLAPSVIDKGQSSNITTLVKDTAGRPVVGQLVDVFKATDAGWVRIATRATNAWGWTDGVYVADQTDTRYATFGRPTATMAGTRSVDLLLDVRDPVSVGQQVVQTASRYAGTPYRWGASGPGSFDCSGFTSYVYRQYGVGLPHSSAAQRAMLPNVSRADARPGDLVFSYTGGRVTHVGIYAGSGLMWAAPRSGDVVKLQAIYDRNYTVGRVLG